MSIIFLAIGTVLTLVFIIFLNKGAKYDYMFESLSGNDFPMPEIYGAGMAMQELGIFKLSGKLSSYLREKTKLIYTKRYSEYYSRVIWAQALSFGLICMAVCFVLAGILTDLAPIMGLVGIVMAVVPGYVFISNVGDKVNTRRQACEEEFPNAISKLALIVSSGVILHDAWEMVAYGNKGIFYDMMQQSCNEIDNGRSEIEAITNFGMLTNSDDIKKFTGALAQSIERGGGELPYFLSNQSKELWAHHRQAMLQKGEKAASALLMPIALMFFGVMLIVIFAAIQSFSL